MKPAQVRSMQAQICLANLLSESLLQDVVQDAWEDVHRAWRTEVQAVLLACRVGIAAEVQRAEVDEKGTSCETKLTKEEKQDLVAIAKADKAAKRAAKAQAKAQKKAAKAQAKAQKKAAKAEAK